MHRIIANECIKKKKKKKEKGKEPKTLELAIELKLSFFQAGDSHLGDMETKFSSQYYFKSYKNGVIIFKF